MTESVLPIPLWRRIAPWAPLYAVALVPSAMLQAGWTASVIWLMVCAVFAEQAFGFGARPPQQYGCRGTITRLLRHPAGALLGFDRRLIPRMKHTLAAR